MARKFLSALDLSKNELQNVALQNLSAAPSSPVAGQIYFNTVDKTHYVYSGTAWLKFVPSGAISNADIASDAAIALSKLATDPLARANHTGTQASSTISDLATTVKGYKLNEFAAPTSDVSLNSQKLTNVATPTSDNDAANKKYVDDAVAGLTWKESVHLLATANVPLTGNTNTVAIDGHATLTSANSGYRLLLTGQSTAANNGIYDYVDGGTTYTLTRSVDSDTVAELVGATVFVMEGTGYGKTSWTQSNTYLADFANQTWVQFSGASAASAGAGMVANGNAFDVVGTSNRITVNADSIDISASYVGQTSITTLGTVSTGTWNGTTVDVAHGGTGASTLTSGSYLKGAGTSAITAQTGIPAEDITSGTLSTSVGGTGFTTGTGMTLVKSQAVGSGVSAVTVTGAFSSTFDNYRVVYSGGTGSTVLYLQMKLGSAATGYYAGLYGANYSDGSITLAANNNAAAWTFMGTAYNSWANADVTLYLPYASMRTLFTASHITTTAGRNYGGYLNDSTSYTDFTFTCSTGTITGGTIYVYGLKK